ncbi:MAG: Ppx/GppA phosphatase family protein [Candidatus Ancaeobacter aquaticus]|nr:Ppx/GppA phosphatase family protein [Candidatus Ancaeobacter aquaticus]
MILSAIDVGTNSIRYMIARYENQSFSILEQGGTITRIGKNLHRSKKISLSHADKSVSVIKEYMRICKRYESDKTTIIATSALRDAENGIEFITSVSRSIKTPIRIISGTEEALLVHLGVSHSLKVSPHSLIVDIGGGSTECIIRNKKKLITHSFDIGAVRLKEKFLFCNPPKYSEYKRMDTYIKNYIATNIPSDLQKVPPRHIICAGGTITTLAAIKLMLEQYDHDSVHGLKITRNTITNITDALMFMKLSERKKVIGLSSKRADIIVPGLYILDALMNYFSIDKVTVSDRGILFGILVDATKNS